MRPLKEFSAQKIRFLFSDIDDTMTDHGQLTARAYESLWSLYNSGVYVIPVTGRPAGWCEMIARFWPVHGVIGENGAFYFRYHQKKMLRHFSQPEDLRKKYRAILDQKVLPEILSTVKGSALASDQFCRLADLAIDYCEDVPALTSEAVQKIVQVFEKHGAIAKVSSIHVNGWFGEYDKLTMCREFLAREFALTELNDDCAFVGDSPNDEPMFHAFKNSFAVANIKNFLAQMKSHPAYVASHEGGQGFQEITEQILKARK